MLIGIRCLAPLALALCASASHALAEPRAKIPPAESPPRPSSPKPSDGSPPADAPPAHEAAGYLVAPPAPSAGWRTVPRIILAPLRLVWYVFGSAAAVALDVIEPAFARAGGTSSVVDDDPTGPTVGAIAYYEHEYGTALGARGTYRFALGPRGLGEVALGAAAGGRYKYGFDTGLRWLGRAALTGRYVSLDEEQAFDIPVDGATSDARYEQKTAAARLGARVGIAPHLGLAPSLAFSSYRFEAPAELMSLPGFDEGVDEAGAEIAIEYDTLRADRPWVSAAVPSSGWLVRGRAGFARDVRRAEVDYVRSSLEASRLFDLYAGDRVLVLSARMEAVIGDRAAIPFVDLPSLGGDAGLRGYPTHRFRDRVASVATAEYRYGIAPQVTARVFVDAGRTFPSLDELSLHDLRAGFGGGLLVHSSSEVLGRFDIAGSDEGDLFLLMAWGNAP